MNQVSQMPSTTQNKGFIIRIQLLATYLQHPMLSFPPATRRPVTKMTWPAKCLVMEETNKKVSEVEEQQAVSQSPRGMCHFLCIN